MWQKFLQVWFGAVLISGVVWLRGCGPARGRALRRFFGIGVLGGMAIGVWMWSDGLPFGGILAKVAFVGGWLWLAGYHLWTRVIPAMVVRGRQQGRLRALVWDADPRDVRRLRWRPVAYDRASAIAPFLSGKTAGYWLGRTDPLFRRAWMGLRQRSVCDIAIPNDLMLRHVLILGSTGSGKTRTAMQAIVEQQVARGLGLLVLQFKHDEFFYRGVFEAIVRAKREDESMYLSLRGDDELRTATWNPLAWPQRTEVAESFVQATIEDFPQLRYFAAQNLEGLSIILDGAVRRGETLDCARLAELLAETGQSGPGRPLLAYLRLYPELRARAQKVRWDHASELKMMMARLAQFQAMTVSPQRAALDLRAAIRYRQIIVANLDATTFPQAARYVGRLLISFLSAAYSTLRRTEDDPLYLVVLDDFGPVAGPHLANVLSTARGFGVGLVLATQSLADLRVAGQREGTGALAAQIVENVGTQVVFSLRNPDEAEWWSKASGTVLRDTPTETLASGVGEDSGARLHVTQRESNAISVNELLFVPRSKAFVWVPSRRCLWLPGGRRAFSGRDLDRRELVPANFVLPPDPPAWPHIVGGKVVGLRATLEECRPDAIVPPPVSAVAGSENNALSAASQILPAGILGSALFQSALNPIDVPGEESGRRRQLQGGGDGDRPDGTTSSSS